MTSALRFPRGDRARRWLGRAALLLTALWLLPGLTAIFLYVVTPRINPDSGPPWPRVADSAVLELAVRNVEIRQEPSKAAPANPHHPCLAVPDWALALHSVRQVELDGNCRIIAGVWNAPLAGLLIDDPKRMTAEPVVPIALAGAAGLDGVSEARWLAPSHSDAWLWLPMLKRTAAARAGRGIADWQPAAAASACHYARRWLAAVKRFRLTVTSAEKAALTRILNGCGG